MHKVSVIGYTGVIDTVVELLQRVGVLEIEPREIEDEGVRELAVDTERLNATEEVLARAQFVRDFLGNYHEAENKFASFIAEKIHLTESEYYALKPDADFDALYHECENISSRVADINRECARLQARVAELEPWRDLRLQIQRWQGTKHVVLFTGTVPVQRSAEVRQAVRDVATEVSIDEVGHDGANEAWVVMAHRDAFDEVRSLLMLTEFTEVTFPDLQDYPAEEIADAEELLGNLVKERDGLEERALKLAEHYQEAYALADLLLSRRDAVEICGTFGSTERTFVVTGWVPEAQKDELVSALEPVAADIDFTFEEPGPDDVVPVELSNSRIVRPFEVLTDLYGRPKYSEIDPTPLLAGSFFLFFGLCVGDAGYGLVLVIACWLIKERLDVAKTVQQFMDLLILGGLASAIVGVATRSYFALAGENLPAFLQYDPLIVLPDEILILLILTMGIGVVHVIFGVCISIYANIRRGQIADAIYDDVSLLWLVVAIIVAVAVPAVSKNALYIGFIGTVILNGRIPAARSIGQVLGGVGKGLLGIYGMVGLGSDILSYSRLAALGLASVLVGDVMNRLAFLTAGDSIGIGLVFAAMIFIVGHGVNLIISLLGAFVHPTRLHFVEFFGKFYEGGGQMFSPFRFREKFLVLHPVEGEQEGGTSK